MEQKVEGRKQKAEVGWQEKEDRRRRTIDACARQKTILVMLAVSLTMGQAQFDRTALLINVPTANVLNRGSLAGAFGLTLPLTRPSESQNYVAEIGVAVRFAPIDRLEVGLTAYTLRDYVLGATYRLLGRPGRAGLAVGIHDIGVHGYVSPVGHDDLACPDWKYPKRQMENLSAFAVASIPLNEGVRAHLGLGRGRYVGYDRGRFINTDIFLRERHQWAVGLMGGFEVDLGQHLTLVFDLDGRDVNAGVKLGYGQLSAAVAVTKLEGFTNDDYADRFGRVAFSVGYQLDNLYRRKKPAVKPQPIPAPEPEPVAVETETQYYLEPVYFGLDKSDIRTPDAEILKRNADAILARVEAGQRPEVVVEGHCCPLATSEYNMALGMRRAKAARDFLVGLGVDSALLKSVSYGEEQVVTQDTSEYYLNRRCEFRLQEEEDEEVEVEVEEK